MNMSHAKVKIIQKLFATTVVLLPLFFSFSAPAQSGTVHGTVFLDKDGDGLMGKKEKGIGGVAVSDGFTVVLTDRDGNFSIELGRKARFVTVYTPSGYHYTGCFYKDVRNGATGESLDFGLVKAEEYGTFAHMSDIEELEYKEWIERAGDYTRGNDIDFIAVTGDICYTKGIKLMSQLLTRESLGRRAVFSIGNHDIIEGYKDRDGNPYGEKLFEDHFGPSWYAFSVKGVHFLVTPMLEGDGKPSYSPEDIQNWEKAYLSVIPEGAPVIVLNHNADRRVVPEDGNVKAFFYGHRHTHYRTTDDDGILFCCSAPSSTAGCDHCPSSLRQVEFDLNGVVSTEFRYFPVSNHVSAHIGIKNGVRTLSVAAYDGAADAGSVNAILPGGKKKALSKKNDFMWETALDEDADVEIQAGFADGERIVARAGKEPGLKWMGSLGGGKPFLCNPILSDGHIYIATTDNDNADKCGIWSISASDGSVEWFFKTKNSIHSDIALYEGVIYAGDTDYNAYAVNAADGSLVWTKRTATVKYPVMTEGVHVDGGLVFFGTGRNLCALDAKDGTTVWKNAHNHPTITNVGTNRTASGALLTGGYWYGRFCYDQKSGEPLWELRDHENKYSCCTPAAVDTTFIYAGSNSLIQVGARSGKVLKSAKVSQNLEVKSEPLIIGDKIIVGTSRSGIAAFNLADFSEAWSYQTEPALIYTSPYTKDNERTVECSAAAYLGNVITGANDGRVYCLTQDRGKYVWHIDIGLPVLNKPIISGNDLIIIDFAGNIYCYDLTMIQKDTAFMHSTYSVLSRLVPEEMEAKYHKEYDFVYIQAMPKWKAEEFDRPMDVIIDSMVTGHRYERQEIFETFRETVHEAGCKLLLSFSGGRFINIATDSTRLRRYAVYMASIARHHGYDGIELDWEGTVTKELHLKMIQEVRACLDSLERLDGRKYWLTTALNCEHSYSKEEAQTLSASLDWINIMYYDMGGGYWGRTATHNAPLDAIKENYLSNWSRFDRKKIHIGLANYGYWYEGIRPGVTLPEGDKLSKHGGRDFFLYELPDLLEAGWKEVWDEKACAPYYYSPDGKFLVSADSQRAIDLKVQWARDMGFGGVFWWEFHCDWIYGEEGGRHLLNVKL